MFASPWISLLLLGIALYLFRLWWADYQFWQRGKPNTGSLPGATSAPLWWILIGAAGALLLAGIETGGEYALGVVNQQSTVTFFALFTFIAAGFYEELIFRGYIYYDRKGPRLFVFSIIAASLVFALLHFQYYIEQPEDGGWFIRLDAKSLWTLTLLMANSLWFYYLRFSRHNPHRSLLPCFIAHITSNCAVFAIKAAQGFVQGWW